VVREGLFLLWGSKVLRGLVLVEVFWSIATVVFEQFMPIRLAELLGNDARAGTWMGPVAASGWAVFALGAGLAGLTSRRIGVARTAILARLLSSLGAIAMGLVAGPAALVIAYLATYAMHGAAGPMHGALLHREASAHNRATLLSMNSMTGSAAFAVSAPLLGLLAASTSNQAAMITAGVLSLAGALCYWPALRQERSQPSVVEVA
jgi:MFS family permease